MTLVRFDPDAQAEFLAAVHYYEDCQRAWGVVSVLQLSLPSRKSPRLHSDIVYSMHPSDAIL